MVYVAKDGTVLAYTPLRLKIYRFFAGIIFMIVMFFQTLVNPDTNSRNGNEFTRDHRPGSGPPRPPTRRLGRPQSGDTINIPFGGCRSCAG